MKAYILIIFIFSFLTTFAMPPKHEIRGAWLTTIWRLDWPSTLAKDSVSTEMQKRDLLKILDHLHFLNFNAVFLQVRLRNDVIYASKSENWSNILTGKSGKSPGYDPLQFAIEECHKRGLECHAWIVTIPIGNDLQVKEQGKNSITKTRPYLCKRINKEWFLDPGHPETPQYLAGIAAEITANYDLDGIHLDYIRYPENGVFPDSKTKALYGKNQNTSDWRRNNINRIVFSIYDTVKSIKPWVQVSSSLIGKYNDLATISSHGWNGYGKVMQDAKSWIKAGKHDFIVPMMYFREAIFKPFMVDWKNDAGNRPVIGGLALYMLSEQNWPIETIINELNYCREIKAGGQIFFRTEQIIRNTKSCSDSLKNKAYRYPALFPPMIWLDSIAPASPKNFHLKQSGKNLVFSWEPLLDENQPTYNIYYSSTRAIDTNDPGTLLACRLRDNKYEMELPNDFLGDLFFCVTTNDRYHNESRPSQVIKVRFLR